MITLITGVPGAGKTLFVLMKHILPELEKKTGRKIVTNIPLRLDALAEVYGPAVRDMIELDDGAYSQVAMYMEQDRKSFRQGVLFIVDECQEHYTKEQLEDSDTMLYFSRHRKYACDFVIITQNPSLIFRKLRALVEYCHYLSKTRALGGNGYLVKTYAGQSSRSKPITQAEGEYKPEYYGFYQSYSQDGLKEISTINASLFTKLIVWVYKNLLTLVIGILLFVAVMVYRNLVGHHKPAAPAQVARPAAKDAVQPPPGPAPAPPPSPSPDAVPKSAVLAEYKGWVAAESCVVRAGASVCDAVFYRDEGGKLRASELVSAGHGVKRLARMLWVLDGELVTSFHRPPPSPADAHAIAVSPSAAEAYAPKLAGVR